MSDSAMVKVRLPKSVKDKLERLARSTKRSRSALAAEAIAGYVEVNEWQIAGIKKALKDLDADKVIPHERVKSWARSLGTAREAPIAQRLLDQDEMP